MERWFTFLLLWLLIISPTTSAASSFSDRGFDQAVDNLFSRGFPQGLVTYFCSLGTNPELGFRWAGTSAEQAVSRRVADEMRAMGLRNVRLEPVPVDVFEFEKASLAVADRLMVAST